MPQKIFWTRHALERLPERGLTQNVVERAVRDAHPIREPNEGDTDWRIDTGRFVVLYDHPASGDMDAIQIITAWPKRRKRRRKLTLISGEEESYPDR